MAEQRKGPFAARPKGKSPAERSEEFDAHQAKLKAEAAERREARAAAGEDQAARTKRPTRRPS